MPVSRRAREAHRDGHSVVTRPSAPGRELFDALAAVAAADPDGVPRAVVDAATRLVDADDAALALLARSGELAEVVRRRGQRSPASGKKHAGRPRDRAVAALVLERAGIDTVVRLDDLPNDGDAHDIAAAITSSRPAPGSLIGVPVRAAGQLIGVLYMTRGRSRPPFSAEDAQRTREFAGPVGALIRNAQAFEAGRRRERWLETLASIATELLTEQDLSAVLPAVAKQARELVEADGAAVAMPQDDATLVVAHVDGFDGGMLHARAPVKGTLLGDALLRGKTIQVEELATDSRLRYRLPVIDQLGPAVYVPLGRPATTHGVLFAYNLLGRPPFDEHAVSMLGAFAAQVAVALELADRRHDSTRLALLEDRSRIARDLHDVVIQRLFAIGLTLEGVTHAIPDPAMSRRVTRAVDDLDQTIKEIRTTIFGLQGPAVPEYSSLRARIVGVVDQAMHSLGFVPSLRFEGLIDTTVPGRLSDQVVAVLREALSNAARHAHAAQVEVKLSVTPQALTLLVDDDGVGMSKGGRRSGLRNMEVRAAAYGGSLRVEPRQPSGTHLQWTVPLRPPPHS